MATRQNSVLLYLVMLLGLILGFLYNNQTDHTSSIPPISPKNQLSALRGLESIRIDYSAMISEQFKELQVFGSLPVPTTATGKADPFR